MMGKQHSPPKLFCYQANLEARVRPDHPLRRVQEVLDFSFAREVVADRYGANGNVSVDPEVIVKMMFLLFFDDLKSERLLMRMIPERLDYLWFLGYGLDDEVPNHSVLSKARRRWGPEVFEALFIRTITQCLEAGLVEGRKIHVDASLIQADASNDSGVKASPEFLAALKRVYQAQEAKLDDLSDPPAPPTQGHGKPTDADEAGEGDGPTAEASPAPHAAAAGSRERVNEGLMSTTDSDAAAVRQGRGQSRFRYKNHRAVDDAYGVITATHTTPGDRAENGELSRLMDAHEQNTGKDVQTVVADTKYGTVENFRECAQRSQCTRSPTGRSVKRHVDHEEIEAARAESRSAAAQRDRRRRRHVMEGSFADAANNHHFKRARWRGLVKQQIQGFLIAGAQNLRILLAHSTGRRAAAGRESVAAATRAMAPVFAQFFCRVAQLRASAGAKDYARLERTCLSRLQ